MCVCLARSDFLTLLPFHGNNMHPQVCDVLTHELMALNAVACAVALGMYGLADNSFDGAKIGTAIGCLNAALLIKDAGIDKIVDVIMANKVFFFMMLFPSIYVAFF